MDLLIITVLFLLMQAAEATADQEDIWTKINAMEREFAQYKHQTEQLQNDLVRRVKELENEQAANTNQTAEKLETQNMYMSFGCDMLELSCQNGGIINVTSAHYGVFSRGCTEGLCCAPHPQLDCTTDVANFPDDLFYLKYLCNNKTSCQYQFVQPSLPDCGEQSKYMKIFYICAPDETQTFAFTAYATITEEYLANDVVIFDSILTNIGNSYNKETSSFICPRSGIYVFALSVVSGFANSQAILIQIVRNSMFLLTTIADDIPNVGHHSYAGAEVVTDCEAGDVVWAMVFFYDGDMFSNDMRYSSFTGFLLQEY